MTRPEARAAVPFLVAACEKFLAAPSVGADAVALFDRCMAVEDTLAPPERAHSVADAALAEALAPLSLLVGTYDPAYRGTPGVHPSVNPDRTLR